MGEHLKVGLQHAHVDVVVLARDAETTPAAALTVYLVQLHVAHDRRAGPGFIHHTHPGQVVYQHRKPRLGEEAQVGGAHIQVVIIRF